MNMILKSKKVENLSVYTSTLLNNLCMPRFKYTKNASVGKLCQKQTKKPAGAPTLINVNN